MNRHNMNTHSHTHTQPLTTNPSTPDKYNIVSQLQNYVFSKELFDKHFVRFVRSDNNKKENNKRKESVKSETTNVYRHNEKKTNNFFAPTQKDSLFWCFYIIKNGFKSYEMEPANFVKEKTEKIKYIDVLRKEKQKIKDHKIKPITEIEDCLANKERIDLKTFISLCILEHLNVIIINKKTFFELKMNESNIIYVVHQQELFRFNIELNALEDVINNYRKNYFQIFQIDKPLLSISSYKSSELNDFCNKLLITQDSFDTLKQKRTKQNMYDLIVSTINKN